MTGSADKRREGGRPYDRTYRKLYGVAPPPSVKRGVSSAHILTPARGFMAEFDYTMQLQVGCPCACAFCYIREAVFLAPLSVREDEGREWGFVVLDKLDVAKQLQKRLSSGLLADKTIYWSGVTDAYITVLFFKRTGEELPLHSASWITCFESSQRFSTRHGRPKRSKKCDRSSGRNG